MQTKLLGIIGVGFDVTDQLDQVCCIRQILEESKIFSLGLDYP
jgi:hypothetical protein